MKEASRFALLSRITRIIVRFPGTVALLGLLLTAPCIYWTSQLYSHLKLDLEELLPRKAQSVLDLNVIRSRLQTTESLAVIMISKDTEASRRFVDDLAARLKRSPREVISGVEHRIDREIQFFERRKALFIDVKDLRELRDYVDERLRYEHLLYNPLNIFSEVDIPEPQFRVRRFLLKYNNQEEASRFSRFPEGYYATEDQTERALLAYLPAGQSSVNGRAALKREVEAAVASLEPKGYAQDLAVHYSGEVQNNIDEYYAALVDIGRSAFFVTTSVILALLFYFRSARGMLALIASLLMARFWAFSFIWFSIGYLNGNSAFMGSIVLGSGITFGVMLLSRYLEERRALRPPEDAASIAIHRTAHATWTAALAAGLAYSALALTKFEGFRQYGMIGFAAMVLCWISAFTMLPALILLMERLHPLVSPRKARNRHSLFGPLVGAIGRHPKITLSLSVLLTGLSAYSIWTADWSQIIEMDLSKLRSKKSVESGAGYWSRHQNAIFRSYLSPMIVLSDSQAQAREIAARLKSQIRSEGEGSLMVSARSIQDFIPDHQGEKVRLLREIHDMLPRSLISRLPPSEARLARGLLRPESLRPFAPEDLPKLIRDKFTEKDGTLGRLVLVEPPLGSAKWTFPELDRFVTNIRETGARVAGHPLPVAGNQSITRDMFKAITQDGPQATLASFAAVVLLLIALFRRPFEILMSLLSLGIGLVWMAGAALALDIKINFLNFIALPIAFGIGVDYGVNILERYRSEPDRDVMRTLRETGSAVTLCSVTTILGYVSLIIASNQAFSSFGWLAVAAEVGTMWAAILTLPSLLLLLEARRNRRQTQGPRVEETARKAA